MRPPLMCPAAAHLRRAQLTAPAAAACSAAGTHLLTGEEVGIKLVSCRVAGSTVLRAAPCPLLLPVGRHVR